MFIQISDYENLKSMIDVLHKKYEEAKELLNEIEKLHADEERELETWQNSLQEIENRFKLIDKLLE